MRDRSLRVGLAVLLVLVGRVGAAQVFGTVQVVVRDAQSLAIVNADVVIRAKASAWSQSARSNAQGEVLFVAVPFGQYVVTVRADGFEQTDRDIQVFSNTQTPVLVQLPIAGFAQSVEVQTTAQTVNPESSETTTLTHREDILTTTRASTSADRTIRSSRRTSARPIMSAGTSTSRRPPVNTRSAWAPTRSRSAGVWKVLSASATPSS